MRPLTPLLCSSLLLPFSVFAAAPATDLSPEQVQEQEWDTQCRALLPYGQGDLEAALLTTLRRCINEKRNAQAIADKITQERKRLSDRTEREQSRRAETLARIRGSQLRIINALRTRVEQGTALQLIRTRANYQRVHQRLRDVRMQSATED